ncbi:MAG: ABC-F family ATP-binding cassette domain-containing protein [Bacilli bacterium]|nr:ABC-F family ATP-binding cassette domain-containing protein [Bacilli bacterium]MBN2876507.1 ABC-F family ATP-binding cassette domain-containing protein [Bacilli bacterium]
MLEIRKLTIQKIAERRTLLADLSFVMNTGDKFAVIGLEGIGKSTLLKAILGMELPYVDLSGEIQKINTKIGYLPQNIRDVWKQESAMNFLLKEEPLNNVLPEQYAKLGLLEKILNQVKFAPNEFVENKKMSEYSGGEIVKLGLTKILLDEPDVLLLDEPTNDLDLDTILFLEDFILTETRPILFISHDEALLEHTANGIIHLMQTHKNTKAISVFSKMTYTEYKKNRINTLDSQETIARKQRADHKRKMERFRQIYQRVEHLQNQAVRNPSQGRLLKKKMHSLKSTEARYNKEQERFLDIPEREEQIDLYFESMNPLPNNKTILEYHNEQVIIGGRVLARDINWILRGPKKVAIIGSNGIGKTTFLKKIHQDLLQNPSLNVGYMSQNYTELLSENLSIVDGIRKECDLEEHRIRTLLGSLNFTVEEMLVSPNRLSGGQQAKLLLLKLVLSNPNVLLLDEPTRNLSPLSLPVIHQLLKNFRGCIICVTHDRNFIEAVFDDIYELKVDGLHLI